MGNWKNETENRINTINNKINESSKNKLQLDSLLTVVNRISKESHKCEKCEYLKKDIEDAIDIIENKKELEGTHKKAYDLKVKQVISHLKKQHKLYTSTYYSNQYVIYGLIGGLALALSFFDQLVVFFSFLIIGPIIGRFIGSIKDKKNTDNII